METKKSNNANIEKLRVPITLLGLFLVGSLVLASFSFTSGIERDTQDKDGQNVAAITYLEVIQKPDVPDPIVNDDVILPPDDNILIDSNKQVKVITKVVLPPPPPPPPPKKVKVVAPPIKFPDVEAEFTGGVVEMKRWVGKNVNFPETAIRANEEGIVYLSFVVEIDGSLSDISIIRGVSHDLDKEAKRLLRNMPKWTPGEVAGLKVRTVCSLPINFELE